MHLNIIENYIHDPNLTLLLNFFIFIFGLCLGSFFNVCIYRIPRRESVVIIPSHCTTCGKAIKFYENIPIISWLMLGGKCSKCKGKISIIYPVVELITAVLVLCLWFKARTTPFVIPYFFLYINLSLLFIPTFFIDIKYHIIPNKLTYSVIVISFILSFTFPVIMNTTEPAKAFFISFGGFFLAGASLGIFALIGKVIFRKTILGYGDVKYMAAIGASFGLVSHAWFLILVISAWLGAFYGIFQVLFKKEKWSAMIPFGPFLVIGSYLWIFYGEYLESSYLKLLKNILC